MNAGAAPRPAAVVELSHDSRPIIGRGPPLGATFLTLAMLSIALMVADQRYDQLARVREWLSAAAYPVQVAVDLPFRAWDWLTGSFADRSRLRQENLELTARLRLANLQLQRFAALEDENRRLRDMRENSAGVAERVLVASILNVDLDPFRHRVLVDKGAADGVFKGQAVLDADGIFGQVAQVHAAHRRGDPDQRRRARHPRAVEPQRPAHASPSAPAIRAGCRCPSSPSNRTSRRATCCSPPASVASSRAATRLRK